MYKKPEWSKNDRFYLKVSVFLISSVLWTKIWKLTVVKCVL